MDDYDVPTMMNLIRGIHPTKTEAVDERCGRRKNIAIPSNLLSLFQSPRKVEREN